MKDLYTPLTDNELEWLDNFLLERIDEGADTEEKNEGILDVSELDGFFTAIVSGPKMIPPSQWIEVVWGDFKPIWETEKHFQRVFTLMMRHMNGIASWLMTQPEDFEALFLERTVEEKTINIVDEWCHGYICGVKLAADDWGLAKPEMAALLDPIRTFCTTEGWETLDKMDIEEVESIQQTIVPNARKIHAYWLKRRQNQTPESSPFLRSVPRVGRNDLCPCGSEKKYKRCCLH